MDQNNRLTRSVVGVIDLQTSLRKNRHILLPPISISWRRGFYGAQRLNSPALRGFMRKAGGMMGWASVFAYPDLG
jgi:hypothetical protein